MRQGLKPLELALIVLLFCLPLFVGLGQGDLRNDEAIYSYAVDSIIETGDWLAPRSSPNIDVPFLEKPPLKFWIVAAPIWARLLPHTEFGLRFWDALFGCVAFLYVYLIGRRLAGPICGAGAVLLLFVHSALLFEHGLRENNMEAALVLAYCGGIYHFHRWMARGTRRSEEEPGERNDADGADRAGGATVHALAVGGYFALGFLTKFVAVLFLPVVLAAAALLVPAYRARLRAGFHQPLAAAGVAIGLIVPWFIYAHLRFGELLWRVMFRDHVYQRFRGGVDPRHLQPLWFYPERMQIELEYAGAFWLVVIGLLLFAFDTIRRRRPLAVLALLWLVVPLALISASASKLYHYAYPFLPPLAIAGAYLPARLWEVVHRGAVQAARALARRAGAAEGGVSAFLGHRPVRLALAALAGLSVAVALVTLLSGPIRIQAGSVTIFRNSSVLRPAIAALVLAVLAGASRAPMGVALVPLLLLLLPLPAYRETLRRLETDRAPLRAVRDCVLDLQARQAVARNGAYAEMREEYFQHQYYYYFRVLGPWEREYAPRAALLYERLFDPSHHRPLLVTEAWYSQLRQQLRDGQGPYFESVLSGSTRDAEALRRAAARPTPPMVDFTEILLLLPGSLGICAPAGVPR